MLMHARTVKRGRRPDTKMQFHLTSNHRNRQVHRQTGLLICTDGDGQGQYTSSSAYRAATIDASTTTGIVFGRDHLSCPIAISEVVELVAPSDSTSLMTGKWQLISSAVAHLVPKGYPNLQGLYACIAIGEYRCVLQLQQGTDAGGFVGQLKSLLHLVYGTGGALNNPQRFPRVPDTNLPTASLLPAVDNTAPCRCHVFRQPPVFYLEALEEEVEFVWTAQSNVLQISVRASDVHLNRLKDLCTSQSALLLHIGGTTGLLDPREICSRNIFGIDLVTELVQESRITPPTTTTHTIAITTMMMNDTSRDHGPNVYPPVPWFTLSLHLATSGALAPGLLPATAYIELWAHVHTPTYGPRFVLNGIQVQQPARPRASATNTRVTVRLMYTRLPALGVLRAGVASQRLLVHVGSWWVAVCFAQSLQGGVEVPSLHGTHLQDSIPAWVSRRGTLLFRADLDKYTHGISLALSLACPQPVAHLLYSGHVTLADLGLPQVCIFSNDGELLDVAPFLSGGDSAPLPIEAGAAMPDDTVTVGLMVQCDTV